MYKIALILDKLKNPNNGLGRVSADFSKALIQHDNAGEFGFDFIVDGNADTGFIKNNAVKRLRVINKFIPAYYGHYDIVHKLHQLPAFHVAGGKKNILTIHDLNFIFTKSKKKSELYLKRVQKNVDKADALVFISNFTKETCFKYLNITPGKITRVIYNGVELPAVDPLKPGYIEPGEPFIFTIGQALAKKNFHVLIPFLKNLPEKIKLVIAGENNTGYGSVIRNTISESGLDKDVIMSGPASEAEKLYLYNNCKAFVFPSVAEGFGLPVVEAMRAGKPVFCSDQTSLKEIGDKYAYFWNSFDPGYMADIFTNGMRDFTEARKNEAYNYSLKFTWEKNAGEYLELYKQVIEQ